MEFCQSEKVGTLDLPQASGVFLFCFDFSSTEIIAKYSLYKPIYFVMTLAQVSAYNQFR